MPPLHDSIPVAIPTETRQLMLITKATATQNTGPEFELVGLSDPLYFGALMSGLKSWFYTY